MEREFRCKIVEIIFSSFEWLTSISIGMLSFFSSMEEGGLFKPLNLQTRRASAMVCTQI